MAKTDETVAWLVAALVSLVLQRWVRCARRWRCAACGAKQPQKLACGAAWLPRGGRVLPRGGNGGQEENIAAFVQVRVASRWATARGAEAQGMSAGPVRQCGAGCIQGWGRLACKQPQKTAHRQRGLPRGESVDEEEAGRGHYSHCDGHRSSGTVSRSVQGGVYSGMGRLASCGV